MGCKSCQVENTKQRSSSRKKHDRRDDDNNDTRDNDSSHDRRRSHRSTQRRSKHSSTRHVDNRASDSEPSDSEDYSRNKKSHSTCGSGGKCHAVLRRANPRDSSSSSESSSSSSEDQGSCRRRNNGSSCASSDSDSDSDSNRKHKKEPIRDHGPRINTTHLVVHTAKGKTSCDCRKCLRKSPEYGGHEKYSYYKDKDGFFRFTKNGRTIEFADPFLQASAGSSFAPSLIPSSSSSSSSGIHIPLYSQEGNIQGQTCGATARPFSQTIPLQKETLYWNNNTGGYTNQPSSPGF
jgi:hypothetical protein